MKNESRQSVANSTNRRYKKTASRRPRHCFIALIILVNFLGTRDET